MIIELGIAAAAAAVGGLLAARAVRKKREAQAQASTVAQLEEAAAPDPFAGLPARIGDVIQFGEITRWPQSGFLLRCEEELICAVLLSEEDGERQATVAMSPPDRNLYWLAERTVDVPTKPPARIDVDGYLLDRKKLLSVALEVVGDAPSDIGASGHFAFYEGTIGDAAVVLVAAQCKVWYGQRIAPGDYDRLGQGEREDGPP